MANSTATQRRLWAPHCSDDGYIPELLDAHRALDAWFADSEYEVGPGSGAQACRPITGGSDWTLHAYAWGPSFTWWNGRSFRIGLADDINPSQNPYGPRLVTDMPRAMVQGATGVRTNNGAQVWVWGGVFAPNHDAMHYQIGCSPADLRGGINPATLPQTEPPPTQEDDAMLLLIQVQTGDDKGVWLDHAGTLRMQTKASADHLIKDGVPYKIVDDESWAQIKATAHVVHPPPSN